MLNLILSIIKDNKKKEAKDLILKGFFNYSDQKKAINKAAKESSKDQKILLDKYNRLVDSRRDQCVCAK